MTSTLHFQKVSDDAPRIAPLGNKVLVRLEPPRVFSDAGLYRAPREFEWTEHALVLAVGNGKRGPDGVRVPIDRVKVGDVVVFSHRPAHEKGALEALFGKRAFLIDVDELDAVVDGITKYDPKNVHITFGGVPFTGIMDGSFIEVERENEALKIHELEPNGKCLNGECPCHVGLDCLHEAQTTEFERV